MTTKRRYSPSSIAEALRDAWDALSPLFATLSFALTTVFAVVTLLVSAKLGGPLVAIYWITRGCLIACGAPYCKARWPRDLLAMLGTGRLGPLLVGWAVLLTLNLDGALSALVENPADADPWVMPLIIIASFCIAGGMLMSAAADEAAAWDRAQAKRPSIPAASIDHNHKGE